MRKYFENQHCFDVFNIECDISLERHILRYISHFSRVTRISVEEALNDIKTFISDDGFEDEYNLFINVSINEIIKFFENKITLEEIEQLNYTFNTLKQNIKKKKLTNQIHSKYIELNFNQLRELKNNLNKSKRDLFVLNETRINRCKNISKTKFLVNNRLSNKSIVKLRNDLIYYRLIDKKQSFALINNVFSGHEIYKKINWIGTKGDLGLFIKLLKKYNYILNINPYIVAKNAFTIDGNNITNLRDPKKNDAEKYLEKIEKIVLNFKNLNF